MTDIVERLRFRADENYEMLGNIHEPLLEAADEIEKLRAALHRIGLPRAKIVYCRDGHEEAVLIARAALEGR